jgi:hypothetical protein
MYRLIAERKINKNNSNLTSDMKRKKKHTLLVTRFANEFLAPKQMLTLFGRFKVANVMRAAQLVSKRSLADACNRISAKNKRQRDQKPTTLSPPDAKTI